MRYVVLLLLIPLAGCLGDNDPAPADEDQELPVVMDTPSAAIYDILPVQETWVTMSDGERIHNAVYRPDTNESVPVFINFSPYWGDTAELGGDNFAQYMVAEYVPRGYAIVLSAIRGTGHSEGCFQIGGDRELLDLNEVVDFFAAADWSNGNIAAGGKSYDSTSQNGMIAKFPHPALKGIFHVSGITDMYRYNYHEGVPYTTGPIFNTYYYLQGTDEYGLSFLSSPTPAGLQSEDAESLARAIDDAACTEFPQMQASGVGSGVTGLKDDYWIERDWNRYIADTTWNGSIFFVHGLQDWNVKPDHILPWLELLPDQIQTRGWLHQWTEGGTGHVYPMRDDWNATMLDWLDTTLKGKERDFWSGPQWSVQADDGTWFDTNTWPAGETIETEATSYVFDEGARVSGAITVQAQIHTDTQSPDPIATFVAYDEAPDGSLTKITEGFHRVIYRDGLDAPSPYVPGSAATVTIESYPLEHVFEPGHALTIGLGDGISNGVVTAAQVASYGGAVVEFNATGATTGRTNPQPVEIACFAC